MMPEPKLMSEPFRCTSAAHVFPAVLCNRTLEWLETEALWTLRVADFYEQWEVHLAVDALPQDLADLATSDTIERLVATMIMPLSPSRPVALTEITAHKLLRGQTIRVHNDFLDGEESYRLLVQLNRGWDDEQGGMLMLFSGPNSRDVRRILRPLHGSAFAFEISPASFHAVSTIHAGERYTLVYSFKNEPAH